MSMPTLFSLLMVDALKKGSIIAVSVRHPIWHSCTPVRHTKRFLQGYATTTFLSTLKYKEEPITNYKYDYEEVIYRGEQGISFDAVYGPRDKNGQVRRLYDYTTGKMRLDVLEHWKQYDVSLYLRNNWGRLKDDLRDKIRISVGNEDTYSLNLPINILEDEMKKINATITFAYYPGDHYTVTTPAYRHDENLWLEEKYQEWLKSH